MTLFLIVVNLLILNLFIAILTSVYS